MHTKHKEKINSGPLFVLMERERVVLRIFEPPQLTWKLSTNSISSGK
ncbi:hypothetical protein HanPSC8_Chr13g0553011 [Helianthus annuus]|nr:hypothetical protein HanPSC8_Chr13g0553011 [Helianthus annuus]